MSKKLLIPLIILGLFAAGLGIFIASNQSAQPSATDTTVKKTELAIPEIDRTMTVPTDLGKTTYQMANPTSITFYSDKYENLTGCAGKPLAILQISATQTDGALKVGGQYPYASFTAQPTGQCSKEDGERLAGVLLTALTEARPSYQQ